MREETHRKAALRSVPVSRETEDRLEIFVDKLAKWRKVTNLISDASFADVWRRHIADSAQLLALAPRARRWIDFGSGAGFPGMVLAIQLAGQPDATVHLIESDQRKCAFLREVARATGASAQIHPVRAEALGADEIGPVDAVTARAFAPLPILLDIAKSWIGQGAVGIFPRGRTGQAQLADYPQSLDLHIRSIPSQIDPHAAILIVQRAESAH